MIKSTILPPSRRDGITENSMEPIRPDVITIRGILP